MVNVERKLKKRGKNPDRASHTDHGQKFFVKVGRRQKFRKSRVATES